MFGRFAVDIENINVEDDLALDEKALPLLSSVELPQHEREDCEKDKAIVAQVDDDLDSVDFDTLSLQQLVDVMHQRSCTKITRVPSQSVTTFSRQKMRDVRVFCNFLAASGKKISFNVRLKDQVRGIEVIEAAIQAFMKPELRQKYSENPRHYQLFMAEDHTGDEIAPIQLESGCQNVTCLAVKPLPEAQLFLFPVRTGLNSPTIAQQIPLTVEIRSPESKIVRRILSFPADLLVEKMETSLQSKLPTNSVTFGSLRVRYGPTELFTTQRYDFGSGCGNLLPISERTIFSLHRFGVTELVVDGKVPDQETLSSGQETSLDNVKRLDEEEARAYQQFEVIKINKFGQRQQRVIGVDAERVYNMRPSSEVGKTKNPERQIEDIETIRDFRDRPTFCEIEYSKASKYDTDKIECRNAFDCAMLVEKLRMLKKIHGRKELKKNETPLSRFFGKFPFGK